MSAAVQACRFGDRCALDTYEEALICTGQHSERTNTEIAHRAAMFHPGKSESYIRAALSPNDETHKLQLALAPAIIQASGNPAILLWLARQSGYGIHRVPQSSNRQEVLLALTDVFDALGPLAAAVKATPLSQPITPGAAAQITVRAQQVITEMVEVIASVNFAVVPRT